jgi:hypothetical protein
MREILPKYLTKARRPTLPLTCSPRSASSAMDRSRRSDATASCSKRPPHTNAVTDGQVVPVLLQNGANSVEIAKRTRLRPNRWECSFAAGWGRPFSARRRRVERRHHADARASRRRATAALPEGC